MPTTFEIHIYLTVNTYYTYNNIVKYRAYVGERKRQNLYATHPNCPDDALKRAMNKLNNATIEHLERCQYETLYADQYVGDFEAALSRYSQHETYVGKHTVQITR